MNGAEFLVILLIAVVVVGPERLPQYAEQLAHHARSLRRFVGTAKERVASELGEEAADVDWASLDPRRYDPRRIVREALQEDPKPNRLSAMTDTRAAVAAGATPVRPRTRSSPRTEPRDVLEERAGTPFDDEAT